MNIAETEDLVNECSEVMYAMLIYSTGTEAGDYREDSDASDESEGDGADLRTNIVSSATHHSKACKFNSHYGVP